MSVMQDESKGNEAEVHDRALLVDFAQTGRQEAFRILVDRHALWVYRAAFRQLRDRHQAEDATQAVFLLLCQQARKIGPERKIAGWLFMATQFTVRGMKRAERRRRIHEKQAVLDRDDMLGAESPQSSDLDQAISRLREADRMAIILRYFRGLGFAELAADLGISEEAARQRVARAVAKLRTKMGAGLNAGSLATLVTGGAPISKAALSGQVSQFALSASASGGASGSISAAVTGARFLMAMEKVRIAAVVIILASLVLVATVGAYIWLAGGGQESAVASTAPRVVTTRTSSETFESVYAIPANETIRRIPPPFSPVRMEFFHRSNLQAAGVPDAMQVYWANGKPMIWGYSFNHRRGYSVQDLITYILNVYPQELEGDLRLAKTIIPGDFVVRGDPGKPDVEPLRLGFMGVVGSAIGHLVTLEFRYVERPVIVLRGKWQSRNANGTAIDFANGGRQEVEIYGEELNKNKSVGGGGSGPMPELANWVGRWIKRDVAIDATGAPDRLSWHLNDDDLSPEGQPYAHDEELVLKHIAEQTGLAWKEETRKVTRLFLENAK